eukprot:2677329-Pyramimonas_sp.AAC.1
MDDDLRAAMHDVATLSLESLGVRRRDTLRWLLKLAADLGPERAQWVSSHPGDVQELVQPLHGPLFKCFI